MSAGAPPRPRWGSLQRSPRPPSCVGIRWRFLELCTPRHEILATRLLSSIFLKLPGEGLTEPPPKTPPCFFFLPSFRALPTISVASCHRFEQSPQITRSNSNPKFVPPKTFNRDPCVWVLSGFQNNCVTFLRPYLSQTMFSNFFLWPKLIFYGQRGHAPKYATDYMGAFFKVGLNLPKPTRDPATAWRPFFPSNSFNSRTTNGWEQILSLNWTVQFSKATYHVTSVLKCKQTIFLVFGRHFLGVRISANSTAKVYNRVFFII